MALPLGTLIKGSTVAAISAGAIFGVHSWRSAHRPVNLNSGLLRDYSREVQKSEPFKSPFLSHFHRGTKHLYYVAASHSSGTENPTCKTIESAMNHYRPQVVIIEGVQTEKGISPTFLQEYVHKEAAKGFPSGEPAYAASLAMAQGIPFMGGEIANHELFNKLRAQGISDKELMANYLLRWIPYWKKEPGFDEAAFDKKAIEYLTNAEEFREIPPDQRLSVTEFKAWYNKYNTVPSRHFLQLEMEALAPIHSASASHFETMSYLISKERDAHLVGVINDAFQKYDRVLVVYGNGHLTVSRPVFEKEFGRAENTRIA